MSAEWNPTDALSFRLAADYVEDNSDAKHGHREAPGTGTRRGEVVLPDVYDTRAGIGDDNQVRNQGVSLTAAWELNDAITLKSITAYRDGETDTLIDFDTSPAPGARRSGLLRRRPAHAGIPGAVRRRAPARRGRPVLPRRVTRPASSTPSSACST